MQVDWLPPIHAHIYGTCNKFDHNPHLEWIWTEITKRFRVVMRGIKVMLTGKGADDVRERTMFLQQMYSRWRHRHHPRESIFSAPKSHTSTWIGLEGE